MATFSGGRYAVLRDQSEKESPEEEKDLHEVPKLSEKNVKKKKKKKKQGDESGNGACKPPDRTEAEKNVLSSTQYLRNAAQYHSDHRKGRLELDTKVEKLETRQDKSGAVSVRSRQANQNAEATTSPGKTNKNKKKKSSNQGILSSEFNYTPPKGTNKKGKETRNDEKGEEGTNTNIHSSESNTSIPKPINEEKETHDNKEGEEGANTSIHSSFPKPIDEEEKETNDNKEGEEGASTNIHSSESNASLPKPIDEGMETHDNKEGEEGASTSIHSSESNASLPKPNDEEEKETNDKKVGEEGASTNIHSSASNTSLPKPIYEGMETHDNEESSVEATATFVMGSSSQKLTDLERFSNELTLLTVEEKERQNLLQVLRLMYDVGLTALRKLFMDIHPSWSNKPADAKSLVKGSMRLKGKELVASFKGGDINKWDVSLITTVLLCSKKCNDEISKRLGFEDAIRSIKDYKNKLVSHAYDEKMSNAKYQVHWPAISGHLETIGASKEDIDTILKENVLENGKVYRDLFLQEVAAQSAMNEESRQQNRMVNEKLDTIIANQTNSASGKSDIRNQLSPRRGGPNWDEWLKFFNVVRGFDHCQNNYILITDAMSSDLMECFSTLRSVPWKMVLDFDSSSEENGMYKDFASKDGKNSLINMITPAEIRRLSIASLARHIDANKTQWMFVNGRESDGSDGGPQDFEDWEDISVKEISAFFKCFSEPEKLDKNKPVVCLVLPFREERADFIDVTIRRLLENFNDFNLNFVEVTPKDQSSAFPEKLRKKLKSKLCTSDLDPDVLCLGLKQLFNISSQQSYRMPSSQAKISAELTQKEYLYLKEFLDVLYEGCEDLPNMTDDETDDEYEDKFHDLIEEHKKSFMSGNWISFLSLSYNHDAKREISNEIRIHIQRLLDQGPTHPSIVEVSHSPGSGGSTIARRVMWDIHKAYPCAFAKLEEHTFDLEDDSAFLNNLAERISFLKDKCNTTPVVLLDGKHTRIEALSNKLARILKSKGKKAVLLRCNHSSDRHKSQNPESSEVHAVFPVNVKLEQSSTDLKEFEEKYRDHIKGFKEIKSVSGLSRVFHFPLVAMLEEFREKLQQIVFESFEEMAPTEREIIIVVAFLQRYAAQATPAPLLYEAFKHSVYQPELFHRERQGITYEDISKIMPKHVHFWNLMVPAYPAKYHHRGRFKRANSFQEMYTLQHPVVAELVLKKTKIALERDTLAITRDFLGLPIYEDNRFIPLMKDLFVQNGCGPRRFSVLFEELKRMSPQEAGDVFYEAAEKTKDVVVVTNAARFYAKVPPLPFSTAKELIEMAFECRNAKEKKKAIYDVNGIVLLKEMKVFSNQGKIKSLQKLEDLADKVLGSFRSAMTYPPTFPNPLIGEVKTWLTCMNWISKNHCHGDTDKALEFITSKDAPPFFRSCLSESFHRLNIVDEIVQTVNTLSDPETTQREANSVRLSLMQTFKMDRISVTEGKSDNDVIKACRALCSVDKFPTSSELEIKRLQVQYVFSSRKGIESLNREGLKYLLDLLTELVEVEKDAVFAKHLMKICVLLNEYSLDKGLAVCSIWSRNSSYDALPYFYEMMIYFLKILDGESLELRSNYQEALENCCKKSEYNCRRTMSTHYLGKTGTGMSRLMTRNTLFQGETEYKSPSETVETYWKTNSRKKLLECCGRIRIGMSSSGKKNYYIELLQSNIKLHVAKSAAIGEAGPDFTPNSKVYFVVSFNLIGPVANGITFEPLPARNGSDN